MTCCVVIWGGLTVRVNVNVRVSVIVGIMANDVVGIRVMFRLELKKVSHYNSS